MNKKVIASLLLIHMCSHIHAKNFISSSYDKVKNVVNDAYGATKNVVNNAYQETVNFADNAYGATKNAVNNVYQETVNFADDTYGATKNAVQETYASVKDFVGQSFERKKADFCTDLPHNYEPTHLDNNDDPLNQIILKNSPIVYLHKNEKALPMSGKDYFEHHNTQIVHQENRNSKNPGVKTILIPAGHVTSAAIYELNQRHPDNDDNIFAEIDPCITAGQNPEERTDHEGNLTTTAYVKTGYGSNGKLYISYIFFYGFNFPYQIHLPLLRIPLPPGEILNAHECDIEHIVEEFESINGEPVLSRIFYSTHGSEEGMWLNVQNPENNPEGITVKFEGTHPVVYAAKGGHGCYPEEGTYVRIFGFANDITEQGIRWTPHWVRLFAPEDEQFNPEEQGWTRLPGDCGKHGVTSLGYKNWFWYDPSSELNDGNPANRHFCPRSHNRLKHEMCIRYQEFKAGIPK